MSAIAKAVDLLRRGELVAFPTETVYGLGADATNPSAVRKIFELKGRPRTNPLICHIADSDVAKKYAREWPGMAEKLAQAFWPGALTIVLPKTEKIVDDATAGLQTVGLRAPDHELTLELLREFGKPLAGPSANKSSHVSPTTAQHVHDEFGDVVFVLDGGPCRVGIESTVLDLSVGSPAILRPGGVSREQIESVIGSVEMKSMITEVTAPLKAPGQLVVHYAPRTKAFRFEYSERLDVPDAFTGIITIGLDQELHRGNSTIAMPREPDAYARHFYAVLRDLDTMNLRALYIEMPPDEPAWAAVRDRIIRATQPMPY